MRENHEDRDNFKDLMLQKEILEGIMMICKGEMVLTQGCKDNKDLIILQEKIKYMHRLSAIVTNIMHKTIDINK